ncbi:DNA-binding MarR family transcriptional regulator [Agromyces flavus]|uniref:DNA-binding MarR family transcriptional regulator n=1 Tax=Agromyces flavus TaxID=589382 RepID=A0A1H1VNX3_9MICO|nr:MarR family transcriptional regulator [Agromyces flavus]MCP2365961.1 DNA-binding MarR family transcriptional regulator [Agromyces flavus]GGI43725.1 MarR family transcriptional regulator [Agromyces flavus]SDS85749.1 DNA-binding transcriptional regulator, MarR family [Agromyces flavus]
MTGERSSGYWYAADRTRRGVAVLNALRDYRAAEAAMRRRTRSAMRMGETDLLAIRFLLKSETEGRSVSPKDLSAHLGISSASTTVLIDRLVRSGHVERRPHPTDRRALVIAPTISSDDEVRATLGEMHRRMIDVAEGLAPEEAVTVLDFLERMRSAVDSVSEVDAHAAEADVLVSPIPSARSVS